MSYYKKYLKYKQKYIKLLQQGGSNITEDLNDLLYKAISLNDHETVITLIRDKGVDVNKYIDGNTSLFKAISSNNENMVKLLIDLGANVNLEIRYTALYRACITKNFNICKILIDAGAQLDIEYPGQITVLHLACRNNDFELVKYLIARMSMDIITHFDSFGYSALHFAAQFGYDDICSLLLDHGVDPNIRVNNKNSTPFQEAVRFGKSSTCIILLQRGADPQIVTSGDNLLIIALVNNKNSEKLDEICRILINDFNIDVNFVDKHGNIPLFYAVHKNMINICKMLIDGGANPNYSNQKNETLLHLACSFRYLDLAKYLTEVMTYEAIKQTNDDGLSALELWGTGGFFLDQVSRNEGKQDFEDFISINFSDVL
jgi:ankyrin repeat protein